MIDEKDPQEFESDYHDGVRELHRVTDAIIRAAVETSVRGPGLVIAGSAIASHALRLAFIESDTLPVEDVTEALGLAERILAEEPTRRFFTQSALAAISDRRQYTPSEQDLARVMGPAMALLASMQGLQENAWHARLVLHAARCMLDQALQKTCTPEAYQENKRREIGMERAVSQQEFDVLVLDRPTHMSKGGNA